MDDLFKKYLQKKYQKFNLAEYTKLYLKKKNVSWFEITLEFIFRVVRFYGCVAFFYFFIFYAFLGLEEINSWFFFIYFVLIGFILEVSFLFFIYYRLVFSWLVQVFFRSMHYFFNHLRFFSGLFLFLIFIFLFFFGYVNGFFSC